MHYDAFISYRHCEPDAAIAEALQNRLEHYHIPRAIRKLTGKKKFSRIFRDKSELPLCADLTDDIYEALDHADFLLLICSRESARSLWVQREVEYFVSKGGRERVLTILADGEPAEVIPDILCRKTIETTEKNGRRIRTEQPAEPLCADIRGKTKRECLRKLKTEQLRLIAAMLGCPYDGLVQRHRAFVRRRAALLCTAPAALLCAFLLYNGVQNRRLAEEQQAALQSRAEYLAQASLDALASGDRVEALADALAVTAEGETGQDEGEADEAGQDTAGQDEAGQDETDTNEADESDSDAAVETDTDAAEAASPLTLYALNAALYSYKSGTWLEYGPEYIAETANLTCGSFSSDGAYYYAVNESGEGFILSGETGELLRQIDTDQIDTLIRENAAGFNESAGGSAVRLIVPYEEHTALVLLSYAGCILDADSGEVLRVFPMPGSNVNIETYALQGDIFACCTDGGTAEYGESIFVFDLAAGEQVAEIGVYEALGYSGDSLEDLLLLSRTAISLDPDGQRLVFAASWSNTDLGGPLSDEDASDDDAADGDDSDEDAAAEDTADGSAFDEDVSASPAGLILYDYGADTDDADAVTVLSHEQAEAAVFLADGSIAAVHREQPASGSQYSLEWNYYTYYPALYDSSGTQLFTGEKTTLLQTGTDPVICTGQLSDGSSSADCLITSCGSRVVITDSETGAVCAQLDFDSDILNLAMTGDDSFIVGTADGWFQQVSLSSSILRSDLMYLSGSVDAFDMPEGLSRFCALTGGQAVFCSITADENMTTFTVGADSADADSAETDSDDADSSDADSVSAYSVEKVTSVDYLEAGAQTFRRVNVTFSGDSGTSGFLLYETKGEECLYAWAAEKDAQSAEITLEEIGGTIYLYLAVYEDQYVTTVCTIDLYAGTTVSEISLEGADETADGAVSDFSLENANTNAAVVTDDEAADSALESAVADAAVNAAVSNSSLESTDAADAAAGDAAGITEIFISPDGSAIAGLSADGLFLLVPDTEESAANASGSGCTFEAIYAADTESFEEMTACVQPGDGDLLLFTVSGETDGVSATRLYTYDFSANTAGELDLQIEDEGSFAIAAAQTAAQVCLYNGTELMLLDIESGELLSQIDISDLLQKEAVIDFAFFREDACLLMTCSTDIFLFDTKTGSLLDSLEWESADEALNASADTLELVTDSSGAYFALKDEGYRATMTISSGRQMLLIFSVDEEGQLYPYAEVSHGYASFAGDEVSVRSGANLLSYTVIYGYEELKARAETLLASPAF